MMKILLNAISLYLLVLHIDCFMFLGIRIIVPGIIEYRLKPCDKNKVYTIYIYIYIYIYNNVKLLSSMKKMIRKPLTPSDLSFIKFYTTLIAL